MAPADAGPAAGAMAPAAAAVRTKRDVATVIRELDVSSLRQDEITDVMLHCASALSFRKVVDSPMATVASSPATYCYTKSGSDPTVSIWSGGFKVGELPEDVARANGIAPCG